MDAFLSSAGYNDWILPALLLIPVIGAVAIWLQGAIAGRGHARVATAAVVTPSGAPIATTAVVVEDDAGAGGARQIAFWTLLIEFIVSVGLWWSFDPAAPGWQAVVDTPWIGTWNARF